MHISEASRWKISATEYSELTRNIAFYRDSSTCLIRSARIFPRAKLADIGCGSSGLIIDALKREHPDFALLYCVDISAEMIKVLSGRYVDERIEYVVAPAEALTSSIAGGLDIALSNAAVWLFDIEASFREIRKVLKPRGRFVFNIAEWDLIVENDSPCIRYDLIDKELERHDLLRKPNRGSATKLTLQSIAELAIKTGFELPECERHASIMTANDWINFYSIGAIAMRSLPHLPLDLAREILTTAMKSFQTRDCVDSVTWMNFNMIAR